MPLDLNAHLHNRSQSATAASMGGNPYLDDPRRGLVLCARLVSAARGHDGVQEALHQLRTLIEAEFLPLSEQDANPTGARAYRDLLALTEDLQALAQFPAIERYFTVAVGGMFSAGKSRFLNRLLGCDLLPTDTDPTTAIPTYITGGEEARIDALNRYHQRVPLDADALQAICHAFNERFGVSFAHILRLIHVQRPDLAWPHITFLDTPGYSKSDSLHEGGAIDKHLAREHLRRADFLIWVVDIQNGTLPLEDMLFLRSLELSQPVLFVFNKADKKTEAEIAQTLAAAERDLARAGGLPVYGITAYSAATGQEYGGQPCLQAFLQSLSVAKPGSPIRHQFEQVFERYRDFYQSERERLRQLRAVLNEVSFFLMVAKEEQALQTRATNLAEGARERIDQLKANENKLQAIRRQALALVEDIAAQCGLPLAEAQAPQLRRQQLDPHQGQASCRFEAALGQLSSAQCTALLRKGDVRRLRAEVVHADSLGFYLRAEAGIEAVLSHAEVARVSGLTREEAQKLWPAGTVFSLHLREGNRCSLIYPPEGGA